MATILRSSKYIRCLNSFTRRIVVGRDNSNVASKCLTLQIPCINSYLTKSYTTVPAVKRNESFERIFARMDWTIQRYGRIFRNDVEEVLAKVRDAGFIQSLDSLLLIRCCGDIMGDTTVATRNRLMQEIWTTLELLKVPVDVSHFNALLKVYLENDYEFSPIEFLTKMKEKRIEPNRVTYQRLILYNCKKGDINGATNILEFMKEKGLPLTESVFTALIIGHSEANDMENANKILHVMQEAGVVPCSSTYTALMSAYAKRGDMDSIKRIITECGTQDIYLKDKELFEVIQVLAANGYINEVDEIISLMPKSSLYNFDAIHAILKVLDIGNVDVAMKIQFSMINRKSLEEDSRDNTNGLFLIRKLVDSKFPDETVLKVCEQLEKQGEHPRAFVTALKHSLINGDIAMSVSLLKALKERGETIREHYLRPLLVAHGKACNFQGIQDVLKLMISDLKLVPGIVTIRDYVLPYAVGNWSDLFATLQELGIPHKTIINAIACRLLIDKKIRRSAMFMMNYPSGYEVDLVYYHLAVALKVCEDAKSFVVIVRVLHESSTKSASEETSEEEAATASTLLSEEEPTGFDNMNVIDTSIHRLFNYLQFRHQSLVDEILNLFIEGGMSLSPEVGQEVRKYFGYNTVAEREEKINKLTSGTLVLEPVSKFRAYIQTDEAGEVNDDNQEYSKVRGSDLAINNSLHLCIAKRNSKALQAMLEDLEARNFVFSPATCAQIIDVFCANENLKEAQKWVKKFKSENPEMILDSQKSIDYAALLIKNDHFDDAVQFILNSPRQNEPEILGFTMKKSVTSLFAILVETGDVEKTNKLFEVLVSSNYVSAVGPYALNSLIKVHLVKDDLKGALNAFEKIYQNHKLTPYKNELCRKFIDAEDAHSLQRLTDLCTQVHGETNALVDLALSFIEGGRLRQARKILETPGLRIRGQKLSFIADYYHRQGRLDCLKQFGEITKGLVICERQELYDIFLIAYNARNNWKDGLSLWTEMQDENLQPSQKFLTTLAALLKRNNKTIPFDHNKENVAFIQSNKGYIKAFNEAVEAGNLDKAEEIICNASKDNSELSALMSILVAEYVTQRNDVNKAFKLAETLLIEYKLQPRLKAVQVLCIALMNAEKYEELRNLSKMLDVSSRENFHIVKYLNSATLREVGLTQFLADFEAKVTDSRTLNSSLVRNLHIPSLLDEMHKDPNPVSKIMPLAERLASQELYSLMYLVWYYYFEQNDSEAEKIWAKYFYHSKRFTFGPLIFRGEKSNNVELLERLHHRFVGNKGLDGRAKSRILSALVDAYNSNGRYDDAIKVLQDESVKYYRHWLRPEVIGKLKESLEANGKSLPVDLDFRTS